MKRLDKIEGVKYRVVRVNKAKDANDLLQKDEGEFMGEIENIKKVMGEL